MTPTAITYRPNPFLLRSRTTSFAFQRANVLISPIAPSISRATENRQRVRERRHHDGRQDGGGDVAEEAMVHPLAVEDWTLTYLV